MITINHDRCIGCGNCIDKCLMNLLSLNDEGKIQLRSTKACLGCLHCAAACPVDAITVAGAPAIADETLPVLPTNFDKDLETLYKLRRSYRQFSDKQVPMEEVLHALAMADWAPSAKNEHGVQYHIIQGREKLDALTEIILNYARESGESQELIAGMKKGLNYIFTTAQTVIIASVDGGRKPATDAAIALTHAELLLQSRGIGTCWAGYFTTFMNQLPELCEYLGFPDRLTVHGALLVGYPLEKYLHTPARIKPAKITVL